MSRLRLLLQSITVEPVLLLYIMGMALYFPVYSQLIEQHICRLLDRYPSAVCANLSAHPEAEARVHGQWAVWMWYVDAAGTPSVILFTLFVAPWSDRFGRKWMMLFAPCSAIIAALQLLANVYWPDLPTWQLLLVMLPLSLSGGMAGLGVACMGYVADISGRGASLSVRMAMISVWASIGGTVGESLGAFLYRQVGAGGPFVAYLVCSTLNVLYITLSLKESADKELQRETEASVTKRIRALLDYRSVVRTCRVLLRHREGDRRLLLHLYVGAMTTTIIAGSAYIGLPFYEGPPINWSLSFFMMYTAISSVYYILCQLFVFPFVKLKLKVHDGMLLIVGTAVSIINHAIMFNARSSIYIYITSLFAIFEYKGIALRALLSRSVDTDEQGTLFGALTIIENVVPLFSEYLFARIFQATVVTMPTLTFGLAGFVLLVPLALYSWADVIDRRAGPSETD